MTRIQADPANPALSARASARSIAARSQGRSGSLRVLSWRGQRQCSQVSTHTCLATRPYPFDPPRIGSSPSVIRPGQHTAPWLLSFLPMPSPILSDLTPPESSRPQLENRALTGLGG